MMQWTIQSWYDAAFKEAAASPAFFKENADHYLKGIAEQLKVPCAEVVRLLKNFNRARLDAQPSLARFPELRGVRELVEAQWRGFRDGAKLDDSEWAAHCGGWLFSVREVAAGRG